MLSVIVQNDGPSRMLDEWKVMEIPEDSRRDRAPSLR
jgi:hypothetical protein